VWAVYFSPTETSQETVLAIAEGTSIPFRDIDLVIAGLPVYAGRLPGCLDDFFTGLNGDSTPAVAVVIYGNREYNDALTE